MPDRRPDRRFSMLYKGGSATVRECPDVVRVTGLRRTCESRTFDMDGTTHETPASEAGCCGQFGRRFPCGSFQHYQSVYGGYYYQCENCGGDDQEERP